MNTRCITCDYTFVSRRSCRDLLQRCARIERLARVLESVPAKILSFITSQPVLGADETRWRLMGKGETTSLQVWTACTDKPVYHQLENDRGAEAAEKLFGTYGGHIVPRGDFQGSFAMATAPIGRSKRNKRSTI